MKDYSLRIGVMGGVSTMNGKFTFLQESRYLRSDDTVKFLHLLREQSPNRPLAVFWDNASIHRAKVV